ncbi:hypothetical protein [Maridesulfovibrio bastinii]|uniref:hypothetical protein n=1 Tax=Maridesulfovibrio bastinii TaxID=47157 RepID=UPI00048224CA|nr:hypothetical protein [Maridesulfovibrio bastinii]
MSVDEIIKTESQKADWGMMTPSQERAFDAKVEKHFRSHRELPPGRNFRCWNRTESDEDRENFSRNYDLIRWD